MTEDEDRAKYFGIEIEEYLKWKKDAGKDLPRTEDKHLLYRATKLYYNLYREDEKDYNYYPKIINVPRLLPKIINGFSLLYQKIMFFQFSGCGFFGS